MSEKCKMHYLPIKPSDKSLPIHIEEKSGANYKSASAMFDVGAALATKQCRLFHNTCPASPQSTQGKSRPADLHTCRLALWLGDQTITRLALERGEKYW
ncbi:hypothetical protein J6590_013004 [Homalodisca vitripennis]|nr:hypothetical protein J6590_013004 [Homalodisca vitripennis]